MGMLVDLFSGDLFELVLAIHLLVGSIDDGAFVQHAWEIEIGSFERLLVLIGRNDHQIGAAERIGRPGESCKGIAGNELDFRF